MCELWRIVVVFVLNEQGHLRACERCDMVLTSARKHCSSSTVVGSSGSANICACWIRFPCSDRTQPTAILVVNETMARDNSLT